MNKDKGLQLMKELSNQSIDFELNEMALDFIRKNGGQAKTNTSQSVPPKATGCGSVLIGLFVLVLLIVMGVAIARDFDRTNNVPDLRTRMYISADNIFIPVHSETYYYKQCPV